jgi:AcrR family transcriptional regulator
MAALAAEMGVARTTLYRWTGDRERLLADVVWADMSAILTLLVERSHERGAERISQIADEYFTRLSQGAMQGFLAAEGETGLRLVTALDGGVRPRLVDFIAGLIAQEAADGHYSPPEDPRLLADVIVSIGERFLHHGGDPAMNPDLDTARRAIALLVREDAGA